MADRPRTSDSNALDWQLRRHQDPEVVAVQHIEGIDANTSLKLSTLEDATTRAGDFVIPLLLIADLIVKVTGIVDLEELYMTVADLAAAMKDGLSEDEDLVDYLTDIDIMSICTCACLAKEKDSIVDIPQNMYVVVNRFSSILERIYVHQRSPCDGCMEGNGFARWSEVRQYAWPCLVSKKNPRISDLLPLIRFWRRKPFMDCSRMTPEESEGLAKFDNKVEGLLQLYPVINILADPACVLIEPVGHVLLAEVVAIQNTIATCTVHPLLSNVNPINILDTAGPVGAVFSNLFRLNTIADARTFASILRVALRDASNNGGPGPQTRICVFSTMAGSFRVY